MPIQHRFAKESRILAGLWQGKGQPPYYHYIMHEFGQEMSKLYFDGTLIDLKGNYGKQTVKFGVFLGSVDLPAECKILNMTQFNGSSGCSTCEEPSEHVKQGKDTREHYPYRPAMDRAVIRQTRSMKHDAKRATNNHQIKGIIGHSGLASMPWFDYVLGIVPHYMHGVFLVFFTNQ